MVMSTICSLLENVAVHCKCPATCPLPLSSPISNLASLSLPSCHQLDLPKSPLPGSPSPCLWQPLHLRLLASCPLRVRKNTPVTAHPLPPSPFSFPFRFPPSPSMPLSLSHNPLTPLRMQGEPHNPHSSSLEKIEKNADTRVVYPAISLFYEDMGWYQGGKGGPPGRRETSEAFAVQSTRRSFPRTSCPPSVLRSQLGGQRWCCTLEFGHIV